MSCVTRLKGHVRKLKNDPTLLNEYDAIVKQQLDFESNSTASGRLKLFKRKVLSVLERIFDTLGYTTPVLQSWK